MKKVRVFNLTDVETPELKNRGCVGIVVAGRNFSVAPGEYCDVLLDVVNLRAIQHAVSGGMLAVDKLPVTYVLAKKKASTKRKLRR